PNGAMSSAISRILPALWLATTIVLVWSLRMFLISSADGPEARFGAFETVARRIAEVDRPGAVRPYHVALDRDACLLQRVGDSVEIAAGNPEAGMACACRAMWRDLRSVLGRRLHRLVRIEDKQDALPAPEED